MTPQSMTNEELLAEAESQLDSAMNAHRATDERLERLAKVTALCNVVMARVAMDHQEADWGQSLPL